MFVPIDTTAEVFFGIVNMKGDEAVEADLFIVKRALVPFLVTQVISCGKGMLGIEANPHAVWSFDSVDHLPHLIEGVAQFEP